MSVENSIDDKSKMILDLLKKRIKPYGQNEMERILKGNVSRVTLKLRLDYLEKEKKLIKNLNANLSNGKSYQYVYTELYDNYQKLLNMIKFETEEYLSWIDGFYNLCGTLKSIINDNSNDKNVDLIDRIIDRMYDNQIYMRYKIGQFYSISTILDAIRSWDHNFTENNDTMIEILKFLYDSYWNVDKAVTKLRNDHRDILDYFEEKLQKRHDEYVDEYPDMIDHLDEVDLKYLNMYKDNKIARDKAYNKIFEKKK